MGSYPAVPSPRASGKLTDLFNINHEEWTVLTPKQAVQKIVDTIDSMHLSKGSTTSLEAPLNAAIRQINSDNNVATCNLLDAFLHQVDSKEASGQLINVLVVANRTGA